MGFVVVQSETECILGLANIVLATHFAVQSVYDVNGVAVEAFFHSEGKFGKVRFWRVGWGDEGTDFAARFPEWAAA